MIIDYSKPIEIQKKQYEKRIKELEVEVEERKVKEKKI